MIKFFGFLLFICNAGIVLAADREFGHPIFRTFTAHDYGEVGQIFTITEDPHGPMLVGCEDAIMVFDNNRWERIPATLASSDSWTYKAKRFHRARDRYVSGKTKCCLSALAGLGS